MKIVGKLWRGGCDAMLNLRDCLDMADVTEKEIAAIARHEHIPLIVALELGHYLLGTPEGAKQVRQFIVDDIDDAQRRHNCHDCETFSRSLARYLENHPDTRDRDPRHAPHISELLAIGQAELLDDPQEGSGAADQAALDGIHDAKQRHDCCACERLSLELLKALDRDKDSQGPTAD
jgi:hypothetical protein